jgi:hypothetical protein
MTVRLTFRDAAHRAWRQGLGLRARRLDAAEAVSIAIAVTRGLDFASDDEQAIVACAALANREAMRTRDVIKLLITHGLITEADGKDGYRFFAGGRPASPRRPCVVGHWVWSTLGERWPRRVALVGVVWTVV